MEKRASDIHIEPLENLLRVRYRIDGQLVTAVEIEKKKQTQIIGRLKAISNMHQENKNHKMVEYLLILIIIFVFLQKKMYMERNSY